MSIFKKREQNRIINQDETTEIPVYGPHDTLCAQNYKIPYLLASFEERFEERCRAWLKNAKPDRYNRGYMDLLIDQLENEAFLQIISGEKPVDYFDTFVVEWYANGGKELTEQVQNAYESGKD